MKTAMKNNDILTPEEWLRQSPSYFPGKMIHEKAVICLIGDYVGYVAGNLNARSQQQADRLEEWAANTGYSTASGDLADIISALRKTIPDNPTSPPS